jgi:hypothetical protein
MLSHIAMILLRHNWQPCLINVIDMEKFSGT